MKLMKFTVIVVQLELGDISQYSFAALYWFSSLHVLTLLEIDVPPGCGIASPALCQPTL